MLSASCRSCCQSSVEKSQMFFDEGSDEVITVIVTLLHSNSTSETGIILSRFDKVVRQQLFLLQEH